MLQRQSRLVVTCFSVLLFCLSSSFYCVPTSAQGGESIEELKQKALDLTKQTRYTEALPLLEKIVVAEPNNAQMHFYLGFALIAWANTTKDAPARKALRLRARAAFIRSKQLEINEPVVDALIQSI